MKVLKIYGASDDLVEFEGAFSEEYNIYERTEFEVDLDSDAGNRSFLITAYFGASAWELHLGFYSHEEDATLYETAICKLEGVNFYHVGKNSDPCIEIPVYDDETVTVKRVGWNDEDD